MFYHPPVWIKSPANGDYQKFEKITLKMSLSGIEDSLVEHKPDVKNYVHEG